MTHIQVAPKLQKGYLQQPDGIFVKDRLRIGWHRADDGLLGQRRTTPGAWKLTTPVSQGRSQETYRHFACRETKGVHEVQKLFRSFQCMDEQDT